MQNLRVQNTTYLATAVNLQTETKSRMNDEAALKSNFKA